MVININNEKDLHYKVIDFIKKYIKEPIIIPGLGEHQINSNLRSDAYYKGYTGGQPDILLLITILNIKVLQSNLKHRLGVV